MQKTDTNQIKLLMTAGHAATTALSLFEEIKSEGKPWEVVWIGTKRAIEGRDATTLEHKIFSNLGIKSYFINSSRLQRKFTIWTIPALLKFPVGLIEALVVLLKEKPDVVVSFGGHVSFPVSLVAFLLGIPVVLHEQTAAAGLANKVESVFASKIAVSRSTSFEFFPKAKTVLVGNLVRKQIADLTPKKTIGDPPVVYITGGSRGSQILNAAVDQGLEALLAKFVVIHQVGEVDFSHFQKRKRELPGHLAQNYTPWSTLTTDEVAAVFKQTDIVVSRAGANTVSEIIVTRKPSILIPIPWVQNNEQEKNAKIAERIGLAKIITESELTKDTLLNGINYLVENWSAISRKSSKEIEDLDKKASKRMLELVEEVVK